MRMVVCFNKTTKTSSKPNLTHRLQFATSYVEFIIIQESLDQNLSFNEIQLTAFPMQITTLEDT